MVHGSLLVQCRSRGSGIRVHLRSRVAGPASKQIVDSSSRSCTLGFRIRDEVGDRSALRPDKNLARARGRPLYQPLPLIGVHGFLARLALALRSPWHTSSTYSASPAGTPYTSVANVSKAVNTHRDASATVGTALMQAVSQKAGQRQRKTKAKERSQVAG